MRLAKNPPRIFKNFLLNEDCRGNPESALKKGGGGWWWLVGGRRCSLKRFLFSPPFSFFHQRFKRKC